MFGKTIAGRTDINEAEYRKEDIQEKGDKIKE